MNYHGYRYLTADQFLSHCKDLNVDLGSFYRMLEFYEKEGVLLPVARIIKPPEYIAQRDQADRNVKTYGRRLQGWEELEKLLHESEHDATTHRLDYHSVNNIKYLIRPIPEEYQPWRNYRVEVTSIEGEKYFVGNTEHYYHYWQVYQAYELSLISNQNKILNQLPDSFFQHNKLFDALSLFIFLNKNQKQKILGKHHFWGELDNDERRKYSLIVKHDTKNILEELSIDVEALYDFLIYLLDREKHYREKEKYLLAKEIRRDIFGLVSFIFFSDDKDFEQIQETLEQKGHYWSSKQLRHLDPSIVVADTAQDDLESLLTDYNKLYTFSKGVMSKDDIISLLKFLDENNILIVAHSIHFLVNLFNSGEPIWFTSMYMGLNGLLVGFETFLKEMISRKQVVSQIKTLYDCLSLMFADDVWWKKFEAKKNRLKTKYNDDNYLILQDVAKDSVIDPFVKMFLMVYFSRNLAFHRYVYHAEFYDNLYSEIYRSVCFALIYTWSFSSKVGLI